MLIGNVGRDPELKHTPSGIPVISFRLATSETWKDRDNNIREHTDWHTIVAWRGLAEVINKIIHKGSRVYIEGRIQTRTFEDRNNNRRHVVEILADNMLLLDQKRKRYNNPQSDDYHSDYESNSHGDYEDEESPPRGDNDIPF
jgi:single-strand DNA-binding protein